MEPQFSLWLVPLAVLAVPRGKVLIPWMVFDALLWVAHMSYFHGVADKGIGAETFHPLVLVRNLLVVAICVVVIREIIPGGPAAMDGTLKAGEGLGETAIREGYTRFKAEKNARELATTRLPTLSVQPLVENAIRHGIEPLGNGGRLSIDVAPEGDRMVVTVRNPVPEAGRMPAQGHGIGLAAVRARLESLPEGAGRLETSTAPGEFIARLGIRMPERG